MASSKAAGSSLLPWLALALLVFLLDQLTKTLILGSFQLGDIVRLTGYKPVRKVDPSPVDPQTAAVIDRLLHGHVIDFLQFHWNWLAPLFAGGYFPSFNIADSAITVGATLLIVDELRRVRKAG